jgi:hypothetical protein
VARRSLKPQLNQIRTWVGQGRTDAWIAHQLEVSVGELVDFKREHDLAPPADPSETAANGDGGFGDSAEEDLRAQDDALVAAALEAEPDESDDSADDGDDEEGGQPRRRRRGRRGGRGRGRGGGRGRRALEGTFDHGEEGYGLWFDASIQDDPVYAEHWAGHRQVSINVERDQIVIRRAGDGASADGDDEGDGNGDGDGE